jgi:hypothetical protein
MTKKWSIKRMRTELRNPNPEHIMSIHEMLIRSLKHKASTLKLVSLATLLLIMVSCIGTSSVPVTYVLPVQGGVYTSATFLPHLEFPDGLPNQADVIIRLNGAEIQTAFDVWSGTTAKVTDMNTGSNPGYALLAGALRDGRNGFQVLEPNKGLVSFNVDVDAATIHVVDVEDNWDGTGSKPNNLTIKGYIEGAGYTTIEKMSVQVKSINTSGTPVAFGDNPGSNTSAGQFMEVTPGNTINEGVYNLTLYPSDHVTTDSRNLWDRPYGFVMRVYDADADGDLVILGAQKRDLEGNLKPYSYKQWMRSNIPLYDQRLNNNGAFSLAMDQIALKSTGQGAADALDASPLMDDAAGTGLHMTECVVDGGFLGCLITLYVDITYLKTNNTTITLAIPNQNSSSQARIDVDVVLPTTVSGSATAVGGLVNCTISNGTIYFDSDISLSVAGDDSTSMSFNNNGLDVSQIISGGVCGLAIDLLGGLLQDTIVGIIGGIVEDIFNVDVPKMRLVVKIGEEISPPVHTNCWSENNPSYPCTPTTTYDPGQYLFGAYLFELQPKMMNFYGKPNSWVGSPTSWDIAWGLNMGFHARGTGVNRLPSLGTVYVQQSTVPATLSKNEDSAGVRTLGATLSEMFINQLFMGLWESGILYIDMDFGTIAPVPGITTLLDNVTFAFASNSPWEVDVLPNGSPEGDAIVRIPDLRVEFIGDAHNADLPNGGAGFTFAYMIADLTLYFLGGTSPEGGALRFQQASAIEISVTDIYSDWDGTTPEQMIAVFDYALTYIAGETAFDIPFPEILGSTVVFGDIWSDDGAFQVTIDVWSDDVFPKSPATKVLDFGSQTYGSNSNGNVYSLDNNVDDIAGNSFHYTATSGNRSYTRTCAVTSCQNQTVCVPGYYGDNCSTQCVDYCATWNPYYWTSGARDWGFSVRTLRSNVITNVGLDGRNDCCSNRMNGVYIRLWNEGALVWTSSPVSGAGTGITNVAVPNIQADEVQFWMPIDTGATYYSAPNNSNPAGSQSQNGIRKAGDGGTTLNFSEIYIDIQ